MLLLGGVGFILSCGLIYTSSSLRHARAFLQSDQQIRDTFGNIKFDVLYSATITNDHSDFSFYVFGKKKNGTIRIEADEDSGVWTVYSITPVAKVRGNMAEKMGTPTN